MMKLDTFQWTFIAVTLFFVVLIISLISRDNEIRQEAQEYANQHGCTYIGRARDLPYVRFFDCQTEVKMVIMR